MFCTEVRAREVLRADAAVHNSSLRSSLRLTCARPRVRVVTGDLWIWRLTPTSVALSQFLPLLLPAILLLMVPRISLAAESDINEGAESLLLIPPPPALSIEIL